MVFDQRSWAADQRDTEAREGEGSLFEVRALDIVIQCFESESFLFSHVAACAEEDAHDCLASVALVSAKNMERASRDEAWWGRGLTSSCPYL